MYNRAVRAVLGSVFLLLLWPSTGTAQEGGVRSLALPAAKGGAVLDAIAQKVSEKLAQSLGLELIEPAPSDALADALADAITLAKGGHLEEASRTLQSAIVTALEMPHRLPPDAPLLAAMTQLASIALAGGDQERADALFARILELDPAFELSASMRSPRVDASLRRTAGRANRSNFLSLAAVGSACADGASMLIVARGLRDGSLELTRFDRCRFTARVQGSATSTATELAAALDPSLVSGKPSGSPYYKKVWFWAGTGAAVAAGSAALYFLLRDDSADPSLTVNPIL